MSQYYVVGGEYSSFNFHQFRHGTERVFGPFKTRDVAEVVWKEQAELTRSQASVRYIILEEKTND
jgi:hypothetical protein